MKNLSIPRMLITMKIAVIAGGKSSIPLLKGLQDFKIANPHTIKEISAIVNVGNDAWMFGLRICPDLDEIMYSLKTKDNLASDFTILSELKSYQRKPNWYSISDSQFATNIIRTEMLTAGYPLSAVTTALTKRWQPLIDIIPVTDDRHETHAIISNDKQTKTAIHILEWIYKHQGNIPTYSFTQIGANPPRLNSIACKAIETANLIIIAPDSPILGIGAILSVPEIIGKLKFCSAKTIAINPISLSYQDNIIDSALKIAGFQLDTFSIMKLYGKKGEAGILDNWITTPNDQTQSDFITIKYQNLDFTNPENIANLITNI